MNNISEKRADCINEQLKSKGKFLLCIVLQVVMILLLFGNGGIIYWVSHNNNSPEQMVHIIISMAFLLIIGLGVISLLVFYLLRKHYEYKSILLTELQKVHEAELQKVHEADIQQEKEAKAKAEDEMLNNKHLLEFVKKFIENKDDIEKVCKREQLVLLAKVFKADPDGSVSNNTDITE